MTNPDHEADPPTDLSFENGSTRLYARQQGTGAPVVLLHGTLANHLALRPIAKALARHRRVITPDLRGAGRSTWRQPLDFDLLADDVVALLRALGLDGAILAGVSTGAAVALRTALRHPEHAIALALIQPVHGGRSCPFTPAQRSTFGAMHEAAVRAQREGMRALHPLFAGLPAGIRERALAMIDSFDPASTVASTALLVDEQQPFDQPAELASLACPTLLVAGNDALHPPAVSALLASALPGCRVEPADSDPAAALEELCRRIDPRADPPR